ncbi:hypothetical protein ACQQ2Q_09615 [Agrobacterium sp. ES01]|uniref:hypothetical protein n=1 Tax=Agrobacterium sp. ES01 TaxID=3420714 RepID=UPI003D0B2368
MGAPVYAAGDIVVLKRGIFNKADDDRSCKISAVMPVVNRRAQYRVQFDDERFVRHVTEDEVDASETQPTLQERPPEPEPVKAGSSWVNSTAIKIRK